MSENNAKYVLLAAKIRQTILDVLHRTRSPHIGSAYSIVEILVALYFKVMNVSPEKASSPDRDRFILSKGHGSPALCTVLEERGFIEKKDLDGFAVNGGSLEQHPNIDLEKGIELSTGSLGHGLSVGVGMALAARRDKKSHKVYVLLSDGEMNEGSVWEAIMFASHHKLDNLVAIVDYNKMQALGYSKDIINFEDIIQRWASFGWDTKEIDGHNFNELFSAFSSIDFNAGKPIVIIAHTTKGKGVSFMENELLWHYRSPDDDEYKKAMKELTQ